MNQALIPVVGEHAIIAHHAWLKRNAARSELQKLRKAWLDETGEWYDSRECRGEEGADKIEAAMSAKKSAQKELISARARLHRAIARATQGEAK